MIKSNKICSFYFFILFVFFVPCVFMACSENIELKLSSIMITRDGQDINGETSFYYGQNLTQSELSAVSVYKIGNTEQKYQLLDYRKYLTSAKFVGENGDEKVFADDLSGFTIKTDKIGYYEFILNYEENEVVFKVNIVKKNLVVEMVLNGERKIKEGMITSNYFKVLGSEGNAYTLFLCEYNGDKTVDDFESVDEFLMSLNPKTSFTNTTQTTIDELTMLNCGTYYIFAKVNEGIGNFESYSNVEMFEIILNNKIDLMEALQMFDYEGVPEVLFEFESEQGVTLKQLNDVIASDLDVNLKIRLTNTIIQDFSNATITNQVGEEIRGKWFFDVDTSFAGNISLINGERINALDILGVEEELFPDDDLEEKYVSVKFVSSDENIYVDGFFVAKFSVV